MAVRYVDYKDGDSNGAGDSFANRRRRLAGLVYEAFDEIRIMRTPPPIQADDVTASWGGTTLQFVEITCDTPLVEIIGPTIDEEPTLIQGVGEGGSWSLHETGLTYDPNDTTTFKQGTGSLKISLQEDYSGLSDTRLILSTNVTEIDLSAFERISFWMKFSQVFSSGLGISIAMYDDTVENDHGTGVFLGVSALSEITPGQWIPYTVDNGSPLPSVVKSIGVVLTCDSSPQEIDLWIDGVVAVRATGEGPSLRSLVGPTSTGPWFPLGDMRPDWLMLSQSPFSDNNNTSSVLYYYGGSIPEGSLYFREPCDVLDGADTLPHLNEIDVPIGSVTVRGGYDTTDMTTQETDTWLDFVRHPSGGVTFEGSTHHVTVQDLFVVNSHTAGFTLQPTTGNMDSSVFDNVGAIGCIDGLVFDDVVRTTFNNVILSHHDRHGMIMTAAGCTFSDVTVTCCGSGLDTTVVAEGNGGGVVLRGSINNEFHDVLLDNNDSFDIHFDRASVVNIFFGGRIVQISSAAEADNLFRGVSGSEDPEFESLQPQAHYPRYFGHRGRLLFEKFGDEVGKDRQFLPQGTIGSSTTTVDTPGRSWRMVSTYDEAPTVLLLGVLAVNNDEQVTVTCRMHRTSSGATAQLRCRGGQIDGVPSDVTDSASGSGSYETLSISFTPTVSGTVEIEAVVSGGSGEAVYVDNITVEQPS